MNYIKIAELDGEVFTVTKGLGYEWKKWDNDNRKMLTSDRWEEGFGRRYKLETDKGQLELSEYQMKDLLIAAYSNGVADPTDKSFTVKKVDGKNGIPNYYINPARGVEESKLPTQEGGSDDLLASIPF